MNKQKGFVPILIVLLIVVAVGGYFVYTNSQTKPSAPSPQPTVYPTPQPSPSPVAETAAWKTYTANGFHFKYPANYKVEERVSNYFVIVPIQDEVLAPTQGISIDARLSGHLKSFQTAVSAAKNDLTNITETQITNGTKISGIVGLGYGQGIKVTTVKLHYKNGALSVEMSDPTIDQEVFDQILSTFKFQ